MWNCFVTYFISIVWGPRQGLRWKVSKFKAACLIWKPLSLVGLISHHLVRTFSKSREPVWIGTHRSEQLETLIRKHLDVLWLSLSVKHLKQTEEWKISLWKIQVNLFQAKFSEHILDTKNRGKWDWEKVNGRGTYLSTRVWNFRMQEKPNYANFLRDSKDYRGWWFF